MHALSCSSSALHPNRVALNPRAIQQYGDDSWAVLQLGTADVHARHHALDHHILTPHPYLNLHLQSGLSAGKVAVQLARSLPPASALEWMSAAQAPALTLSRL